jgi:hypothetical protein
MFCQGRIGREIVAADLPQFIVELYTPGEIIEARRSFGAETVADALQAAKTWINDKTHFATNFRVVDSDETIVVDKLVADLD